MNFFLLLGSLLGLSGMILAALMEHHFGTQVTKVALSSIQTGLRYQLIMAVLISCLGAVLATMPLSRKKAWMQLACGVFFIGTLCFCLSIYLKDGLGYSYFAKLIPWGGGLIILGWLCLFVSAFFKQNFYEE